MYRELLSEFEQMKASGADMEKFASDVLTALEKKAFIGTALKGIGSLGGKLFTKNLKNIKSMGVLGAGLTAAPVVMGQQSLTDAAASTFIPGFDAVRNFGQDMKQLKLQNRVPKQMMQPRGLQSMASTELDDMEKLAESNDFLKTLAIMGGLGAAGYGISRGINRYLNSNPNVVRGMSMGIDRAVGTVGKETVKTMSKGRPLTAVTTGILAGTGKIADKLNPSRDRLRSNFDTLTGDPPKKDILKNLGIYLGTAGAVSIAEEYVTDRIMNKFNLRKGDPVIASPEVEVTVGDQDGTITYGSRPRDRMRRPGDVGRMNRFERPGRFDRPRRFDSPGRPRNFNAPRGFSRQPRETFAFDAYIEDLEKQAVSADTKRLLLERVVKPAALTGTFMLSLAGVSRLLGRNLYGGLEKVRSDEDVHNTGRIMIDIPSDDVKGKTALVKRANAVDAAIGVIEKSRLDRLKDKIDSKIVKGPKFVRKLDNLLASQEDVKYRGKTGIAHWAVEEVPFKAVEGLAYATPMAAVALATGRNAKKAFEPIVSDPNIHVPEGMTRIVIEEHPKKEEKQAAEKIAILDRAFPDELERKIAYMIATSHEYKKPNTDAAISFVKNYKWEVSSAKVTDLQGIEKPIIEDKVNDMVKTIDKQDISPFIVVNQLHGIRPQTPGKKILIDGHHRKEACIRAGIKEVPIYKGTYTGNAERSTKELVENVPMIH